MRFLVDRIDYERTLSMPCSEEAFKLDRMRELLARLGNPQKGLCIVHIAGTKGKGSTAAMTAAVLTAAGHRTGLFTSPHIDRLEERIAIDGQPCSEDELVGLVELIRPEVETMDRQAAEKKGTVPICAKHPEGRSGKWGLSPFSLPQGATYFEIITAAALCHFARRQADVAVLEVGLGGRLDSTNVCIPSVSIITSISFDHVKQLGETLSAIAAEKAGIIKPGVPVISGVTAQQPREVVRRVAQENGCRLVELGVDFDFTYHPPLHLERAPSPGRLDFRVEIMGCESALTPDPSSKGRGGIRFTPGPSPKGRGERSIALNLLGRHQAANAALALAAVEELRRAGLTIPEEAVCRGLAEVRVAARVELVARRPAVVLDAAHNVASIDALLEALAESFSARRRWLLFATTQDKDLRGMLERLLARFDEVIFTRYLNNPRSVLPEELQALANRISPLPLGEGPGVRAGATQIASTPAEAWAAVHRLAQPDDLICVAGSFFFAAEMRRQIAARPFQNH